MTYCAPASDKETGLPSSPKKLSGDAQMLKEHPSLTRLSDGTEMYRVSRKDFGDGMTQIKLAPRPSSSNKIVHSPKQEENHANRPSSPGRSSEGTSDPMLKNHGTEMYQVSRKDFGDGKVHIKLGQRPITPTNAVGSSTKGAHSTHSGSVSPRHGSPKLH